MEDVETEGNEAIRMFGAAVLESVTRRADEETIPEPKRYAWMRDGELIAGTLAQYARMWEGDYYGGDRDLATRILIWDGEGDPIVHDVVIKQSHTDEDDYMYYTFTVNDETASVRIDGRV